MRRIIPSAAARSRSVMAAVVLGTALSAATAQASVPTWSAAADADPVRDITRYCQVCWRNARLPIDRWDDCTQQVFARLLERVDVTKWHTLLKDDAEDRREFIRAIDAVKKRTQRARKYVEVSADVRDDRDRGDARLREQREAVSQAADVVLSPRQRKIVELTADGWAVPDIAAELRTTPERVSDEKYKAIRKLRTHLGVDG
jgi:RNA polymerase sigma factor (sigma-70 family)